MFWSKFQRRAGFLSKAYLNSWLRLTLLTLYTEMQRGCYMVAPQAVSQLVALTSKKIQLSSPQLLPLVVIRRSKTSCFVTFGLELSVSSAGQESLIRSASTKL